MPERIWSRRGGLGRAEPCTRDHGSGDQPNEIAVPTLPVDDLSQDVIVIRAHAVGGVVSRALDENIRRARSTNIATPCNQTPKVSAAAESGSTALVGDL